MIVISFFIKMNKVTFRLTPFILLILCLACRVSSKTNSQTPAQIQDPLLFPKDNYTIETVVVPTSAGEKKVTYRSYRHIPYVANPVDKDYQSLNVSVPIKIDDVNVDAASAPILFKNGVGGYMSSNNAKTGSQANSERDRREDLALAAGYVVVFPGSRGRDNQAADGTYYGKAPAAIVDLKAAVRYVRHNKGIIPGNTDWIVSVGCSAGGALSALLGTSGNSTLYDPYLKEIGAADADDNIYASACYSPITDLEHADMAYEWMYGTLPTRSGQVDQEHSIQLKNSYAAYQASLNLQGKNNFGVLIADNYDEYLLQYYFIPSANKFLQGLTAEKRTEYLKNNSWITWTNNSAKFSFSDYTKHAGRMKGLPAFDGFDMKVPEPILFGNETTNARHFTNFSLQHSTGNSNAEIDGGLQQVVNLMNAMYFLGPKSSSCAKYWWLRNGSKDNHTSQTIMINLATSLENQGRNVNTWVFWDGGHCADEDPEGFINWIGEITGYRK